MRRIKLEEKPVSPFSQGLRRGIEITAVAFVPILLWLLGMIGYRLIAGDRTDVLQPPAVELPATVEQDQQ